MRILVTGATGLLANAILKAMPPDWQATGACHSRAVPGMVQCDLADGASVARAVRSGRHGWVVHCAAIRSPDACERDPARAMEVNASGTGRVARAAAACGARLAYASTDYVFAGDSPPYKEGDPPRPINVYGRSKLVGEGHALSVGDALVVRLPALYSVEPDAPNNILAELRSSLGQGKTVAADDEATRYYTLAEDVAAAFVFLMGAGRGGIVHVSSEEGSTKREFLRAAAGAMALDPAGVIPADPRAAGAPRPLNSHLDTTLYRSLDGPPIRGYRAALAHLAWR